MPEILVYMFEGRTLEQKRALVRSLTDATVGSLGVSPDSVTVQLVENPKSMRARGGVLYSDQPGAASAPPTAPTPTRT